MLTIITYLTIALMPSCVVKNQPTLYFAQRYEVAFSHLEKVFVMAILSVLVPDSKLCA